MWPLLRGNGVLNVTSRCEKQKQKYQNKPLILITQYIYNALGLICKDGNAHTPETLRP